MKETITIVSGLPRSGTSMMMRILERCGLEIVTDQVRKADIDNPNGYYEYEQVKQIKEDASWIPGTRGKAFKMVSMLLYYLPPDENYRIIFMRRSLDEILASERKMLERLGKEFSLEQENELADLFSKHLESITDWLAKRPNMRVLTMDYNVLIHSPEKELKELIQFLDSSISVDDLRQIIDPSLYRQRKSDRK